MTDQSQPATKIDKFTRDILDFCQSDYFLFLEMIQEGDNFLTKTPKKYYQTPEEEEMAELRFNDYLIGRILPYESDYALSGINLFLPDIPSYSTKRAWKDFPPEISKEIDPLKIEREIFQRNIEDRKVGSNGQNSIENIEKRLKDYLKKRLGKKAPSIKSLRKKVNRVTDPAPIIKELAKMMGISSPEEFDTLQQLFYEFWNHTPRDEFKGESPQEISKESMGPLEKELLNDFMLYVEKNMDIKKFSSKDEIEKAVKELQRKWLNEPQEELGGKTPFQAMKEEREKIKSSREGFPISLSINPIDLDAQPPFDLRDINERNSPVAKDLETFIQYLQKNRIKVTPKNHWIPFKNLKEIENNFINPDKDSFVFLGEEENWGEEKRKLYIHFIHRLSKAAKLIYYDQKGYVQIKKKNFQKFTEKSYGEKTIELMITWIEKVSWAELQPANQVKPYASEYQEKIVDLWYLFYQLKPKEKTNSRFFTQELYSKVTQDERELNDIVLALTPVVNGILIRYLKWFGVLDTEEEKIHPDLEVWAIKDFWVTSVGKKLIDKVVLDFWEKGKIKI